MSFKNKFWFCFPLLSGCFVVGAICTVLGVFLLYRTISTLPVQRLANLKPYYYTKFAFFLTTLVVYYSGFSFAGILTVYGVLQREHTKLLPLLASLIVHPFMAFSYNYVYATDWNRDHYQFGHLGNAQSLFDRNGGLIFVIATIVVAYFIICIANGIRMIENEQSDRISNVFDFKILKFYSFFGILALETGCLIISVLAIIFGAYFMITLIFALCTPFYAISIQDSVFLIVYYVSLAITCIFFVALVIGGILTIQGLIKKNYDLMKLLMITLWIQPILPYFFCVVYSIDFDLDPYIVLPYIYFTFLDVYFALCIRNLRLINKDELHVVNVDSEKFINLENQVFLVKPKF